MAGDRTIAHGIQSTLDGLQSVLQAERLMHDHIARERGILLSLTAVLVGFGVLMVYSASITSWPTDFERIYLSRHVIFLLVGISLAVIAARIPAETWCRYSPHLFAVSVALLIAVLIPGVGAQVNGARRWLRLGPVSFQPSELAKLALPLLLARLLSNGGGEKPGFLEKPGFWRVLIPIVVCVPLVLFEPDLGTAVFLTAGCGIALFVGGWPLRNFAVSAGLLIPAAVGLISLKSYQLQRITGFLASWNDFEQSPYQIKQSILSLGTGGLFGVGLGKGQQKLSFLPEANTDFMFAVVGEELGLVGTLTVSAIWIGIFLCGLRMLRSLPSRSFAAIAGFTLLAQLVMQAALNTAVVTGLVPPKGISHPFLSAGGSNLVMSLVSVGILVSLTRESKSP